MLMWSSLPKAAVPVLILSVCLCPVVRTEGKGSRPFVFSLVSSATPRAPVLDIAASSQEELKDWVIKIREVTMTSEAKVSHGRLKIFTVCRDFSEASIN